MLSRPTSAHEVLTHYWDGDLPVNPISIAQAMGVSVYSRDDLDVDGEYYFNEQTGIPTIIVKPVEHTQRMRFTIAHELGHFALRHGPSKRDPTQHFSIYSYDRHEVEANAFAADLLMPAHIVNSLLMDGVTRMEEMARRFDVSLMAMKIRLERMGLL